MKERDKMTQYMARDQYGNTVHGLTHPRKELLDRFGRQHADKIYRDKADGSTVHVGYIVAGHWYSLYEVTPFEKAR